MKRIKIAATATLAAIALLSCFGGQPTVEEARRFVEDAESRLMELSHKTALAAWIQKTYITPDTAILSAEAAAKMRGATVELAKEAARFSELELPDDVARRVKLLKLSLSLAAPADPVKARELAEIAVRMENTYGAGKYCPEGRDCMDLEQITEVIASSRDPKRLLDAWQGWRTVSPPIKKDYVRYVELANEGARELGFADTGAMWRSKFDLEPDEFAAELDRLWEQVRPLYDSLHAYVRTRLRARYGTDVVPADGPIPAHLLGNVWAQDWSNIYPLVAPGSADPGYDLTAILQRKSIDELEMVRYGERFFTSLGFDPLPGTFWERSLFTKPRDRDVVCHASAWDVDSVEDLRIKMCIDVNQEDFHVIHHELGHNFYQRAYNQQPLLFRDSANKGFHEAVGDTILLSVTPEYLKEVGLLNRVPDPSKDIGLLMKRALDKVAFLPFGLLIDQWRWKVFSGETPPDEYNELWWELREKYQGVAAPVERSEADFDPGAKYHVPANYSYTRYFLAHILQFQFHRSLAKTAGVDGPLHRASIYGNKEAGAKLAAMLEMGQSQPWPEALEALTGSREMDATAIIDYFAPLKEWLDKQNEGQPVGW